MVSAYHSSSKLQGFSSTGFKLIDPSTLIEEETIPNYTAQRYYPVLIGEVFNEKYQVVAKLGYGSSSTVWLCRDLKEHRYVALKVYINSSKVHRELPIYNHLNQIHSNHGGRRCLRTLLDSFEVTGPHGRHFCLVHQPLGMSLYDLKMRARGKVFTKDVLRVSVRQLLAALDYLHKEAHVIHTDLQPSNLLMGIDDESIFSEYEKDESEHPIPRKVGNDRTIYLSRPFCLSFGPPVICDLGEARLGDEEHRDDIMPDVYRAPEVILGMKWSYNVDIWNAAMVAWDLFEHDHLFQRSIPGKEYDDGYHLAQMVAILGPPPLEFLKRSENSLRYWDDNGNWRGLVRIPDVNLEQLELRFEGEDKNYFLQFIRKMLCWMPEERSSAEELIFDPWLMKGLFESNED